MVESAAGDTTVHAAVLLPAPAVTVTLDVYTLRLAAAPPVELADAAAADADATAATIIRASHRTTWSEALTAWRSPRSRLAASQAPSEIPMATVAAPPAAANMAAVAAAPGAPRDTACAAPRLVTGLAATDGAAHAVLPAAAAAPGDRLLLDHVCATFRPGTLNVVLGSSGSGKSTLLTEMMQRSFRVAGDGGLLSGAGFPLKRPGGRHRVQRSGAVLYNGRRLDADSVAAT
ncbi:hypothetical protein CAUPRSCDRAFT_12444, partial [Caulochytrium protostelioides]